MIPSLFLFAITLTKNRMTIIALLTSYKDYFAWDYIEMPSLDRDLIEHCLPRKPEFKPF